MREGGGGKAALMPEMTGWLRRNNSALFLQNFPGHRRPSRVVRTSLAKGNQVFFATLCSLNEDPFSSPLHRWHPSLPPPPPPFWPLFVERSCPPPDCDPHTLLRLGPPTKEGKGPPVCLPWQGRGPGDGIAASCPFCVLCMNRARAKKKRRKRPPKKRLHLAINDLRLLLLLLSRGGGVGRRGRLAPLSPSSLPPLKFKSTHA